MTPNKIWISVQSLYRLDEGNQEVVIRRLPPEPKYADSWVEFRPFDEAQAERQMNQRFGQKETGHE